MYLHNVWKKEERKEMILAAHLEPRPKTTTKQKTPPNHTHPPLLLESMPEL